MTHTSALLVSLRSWAGLLLFVSATGCQDGVVVLGEHDGTDGGSGGANTDSSGGSNDTDCDGACDPDFAVSELWAVNLGGSQVMLPAAELCDGPTCPVDAEPPTDGVPCSQTEAALESPLGAEEFCRLSAALLVTELQVRFATPVLRESFEEVRSQLGADVEEPYLWHADVVELRGPGTAFRGDYHPGSVGEPNTISSVFNESCAARLTEQGTPWTDAELEALCMGTWNDGGEVRPLRMDPQMTFAPRSGVLTWTSGVSCATGEDSDSCCSSCDYALGPAVARYGVRGDGERRRWGQDALECDPAADVLSECRDLQLHVDRRDELDYVYAWDGEPQAWSLPRYDKLRETHPDARPPGLEVAGVSCSESVECEEGQSCIGTDGAGRACQDGDDCEARTCRAEWFATCAPGPGQGHFCMDRRFDARAASACWIATEDFEHGQAGDRLALCNTDYDSELTDSECCDPGLGGGASCDPFEQPNLRPVPRYDRDPSLGVEGSCACEAGEPAECDPVIERWCDAPVGGASDPAPPSAVGDYAVPLVEVSGGVRWEAEEQALSIRIEHLGNVSRAQTESCADSQRLVGARSAADGWIAHERFSTSLNADHDLAVCSGSRYALVFAESDRDHHVRSEAGGTLDGRSSFVLETAQFRMVERSGSPTDNLRIHACETFSLHLTNSIDPGPANLRKIEIRQGSIEGPRVAGGSDCDPAASAEDIVDGAIPCLTFDLEPGVAWQVRFFLDEQVHGQVLQPGVRYHVVLPGLDSIAQLNDQAAYAAALHDVCGMPLILGTTDAQRALSEFSFQVDDPCQ